MLVYQLKPGASRVDLHSTPAFLYSIIFILSSIFQSVFDTCTLHSFRLAFLLLLLWVGYHLLSSGYVASGAVFGQYVPLPSICTTQIPIQHRLVLHNGHYISGLSHTELIVQPETSPNLLMLNNIYLSY